VRPKVHQTGHPGLAVGPLPLLASPGTPMLYLQPPPPSQPCAPSDKTNKVPKTTSYFCLSIIGAYNKFLVLFFSVAWLIFIQSGGCTSVGLGRNGALMMHLAG